MKLSTDQEAALAACLEGTRYNVNVLCEKLFGVLPEPNIASRLYSHHDLFKCIECHQWLKSSEHEVAPTICQSCNHG